MINNSSLVREGLLRKAAVTMLFLICRLDATMDGEKSSTDTQRVHSFLSIAEESLGRAQARFNDSHKVLDGVELKLQIIEIRIKALQQMLGQFEKQAEK